MKKYLFNEVDNWKEARKLGEEIFNDLFDFFTIGSEFFVVVIDTVVGGEVTEETVHVFKSFMEANSIMNNYEYLTKESVEAYCINLSTEESVSMFYKLPGAMNYGRWAMCESRALDPSGVRRLFDNKATVRVYFL